MRPAETCTDPSESDDVIIAVMKEAFARQHESFLHEGPPSEAVRRNRIDRAIGLLVDNQHALASALDEDFSGRAHEQTLMLDVYAAIEQLKYCRRHLRWWKRAERRRTNFPGNLFGARAEIQPSAPLDGESGTRRGKYPKLAHR